MVAVAARHAAAAAVPASPALGEVQPRAFLGEGTCSLLKAESARTVRLAGAARLDSAGGSARA